MNRQAGSGAVGPRDGHEGDGTDGPAGLIRVVLADEEATARLAARLARLARKGDVLALWGDLGAGKTAFARSFIRARIHPHAEVPSPTFTLVQVYAGAPPFEAPIHHFDLYRIAEAEEALELGLDEALADGVSLIEWPDRLGALLPLPRLDIRLTPGPTADSRVATIGSDETGDGNHEQTWSDRLAAAGLV